MVRLRFVVGVTPDLTQRVRAGDLVKAVASKAGGWWRWSARIRHRRWHATRAIACRARACLHGHRTGFGVLNRVVRYVPMARMPAGVRRCLTHVLFVAPKSSRARKNSFSWMRTTTCGTIRSKLESSSAEEILPGHPAPLVGAADAARVPHAGAHRQRDVVGNGAGHRGSRPSTAGSSGRVPHAARAAHAQAPHAGTRPAPTALRPAPTGSRSPTSHHY